MRLTKTLYIVEEVESDEPVDFDQFGRPIYGTSITKTPISCEIEPYSNTLASNLYGISVEVSNRVFTDPHEKLVLGAKIKYKDEGFIITECMQYDRHYEVLIKKGFS